MKVRERKNNFHFRVMLLVKILKFVLDLYIRALQLRYIMQAILEIHLNMFYFEFSKTLQSTYINSYLG